MTNQKILRRSPRILESSPSTPSVVENGGSSLRSPPSKKPKISPPLKKSRSKSNNACFFVGEPIPADEAKKRWSWRYEEKGKKSKGRSVMPNDDDDDDKMVLNVKFHYAQAQVEKCIFDIGDCAYVKVDHFCLSAAWLFLLLFVVYFS